MFKEVDGEGIIMADTEIISVGAVKSLIANADRLKSFIRDGDKEPIFDGAIYVYSDTSKSNESYDGRIHVQVKSESVDNPFVENAKYSISREEFKAYLKEGGVAFFFVLVSRDGERNKVFYTNLLPFKIKRLIAKMGSNNSKKTQCLPFPTTSVEITDWALNYLYDCEKQCVLKQRGFHKLLSREQLEKSDQISHYEFGFTSSHIVDDPFERLFQGEFYIYAALKSGFDVPVELVEGIERVLSAHIEHDVTIGDRVYFNNITLDSTNEAETLCFGKNISITKPRKDGGSRKATLKYELTGTLPEMISDAECIVALAKEGKIVILGDEMTLTPGFDISGLEELLHKFLSYRITLGAAGATEEIDVINLSAEDKCWLNLFETALVDNQEIFITPSVEMKVGSIVMSTICVANLSICLLIEKTSENGYRLHNPQSIQ